MAEQIRVRGHLLVSILVPHEFTVDAAELDEWMQEGGGAPWDGSGEDIREFIAAGDPSEWQGVWPKADPDWHPVESAELVEVEVIGTEESGDPRCADHKPVQHRDARPPWCNSCGLTASFEKPVGRLDQESGGSE